MGIAAWNILDHSYPSYGNRPSIRYHTIESKTARLILDCTMLHCYHSKHASRLHRYVFVDGFFLLLSFSIGMSRGFRIDFGKSCRTIMLSQSWCHFNILNGKEKDNVWSRVSDVYSCVTLFRIFGVESSAGCDPYSLIWSDFLGAVLWFLGLTIESVADWQKFQFKLDVRFLIFSDYFPFFFLSLKLVFLFVY